MGMSLPVTGYNGQKCSLELRQWGREMDVIAIQAKLRVFARDRGWKRKRTPSRRLLQLSRSVDIYTNVNIGS